MTHRFFKSGNAVYEAMRSQVDAAWGYPTQHTVTCIPPAAEQYKDADGNCIIGVKTEWCEWEPVATLLPQLLSEGQITEITEAEYWSVVHAPLLPEGNDTIPSNVSI